MTALLERLASADNTTGDPVTDEAVKAPEVFFNVSSGNDSEVQRTPGLILTKQQIVNLKQYELVGLALPTDIDAVISYLGYSSGAGAGLEPEDFLKSYRIVHTHAKRWSPLRTQLLTVGDKLKLFAGEMLVYGTSMDDIYNDIKSGAIVEQFDIKTPEDVKRLKLELGDKFPGIELSDGDKETAKDIGFYLSEILNKVKKSQEDAQGIKEELEKFGLDLALYVTPEIQRKVIAIDNSSLPADVTKLNDSIERRAKDIDEKNKEYKAAVERSLGSVSKLNIAGLALGIYFGVEAEGVRKARNELISQQTRDIDELQLKNKILGSLNRVKFDLQNLVTVVIDADIATKNLITVWNKLYIFIETSAQSSAEINDALSLRVFMNRFRKVVQPWKTIEQDSDALLNVFKEADEEFKRIYGK
ncbi:alpha-xenorhabdolysin family binary toxin subunit A [Pseudomonas lijiangensis]|uniref:Alpha-xenorhabdolysin family binary toxin subunit A n=1 Tax=Pseudomonas lijiangensis TaxID=2995658 RepID=A0ABX8HWS4_9PSED|nr:MULTISPECIES: alpha-xenorhabdolysin family binary toxin subunit A [Pseudomonas syringae group]MBX8492378.1 alpha-xenorhabdolysin family binary toxin subunit A [Pseudomonas cichorii]MBX8502923.1 alpha-xenorhabdolysin family binary toxin subunit A [Pseudomonas lijiangensis]MBX8507865.1 alpha-xenorhabdolysin family binary toxin subunit A [Pseudomonas lijiangensis]MBX8522516.1 alpha-xenorhabdolysin family binary toxin subunit A [Pseudomonas cichorii]MBX8552034.1 alpha-xenorhabdolysin family bin